VLALYGKALLLLLFSSQRCCSVCLRLLFTAHTQRTMLLLVSACVLMLATAQCFAAGSYYRHTGASHWRVTYSFVCYADAVSLLLYAVLSTTQWADIAASDYMVRGPTYLTDRLKVTSAQQMFDLCAVDLFQVRALHTHALLQIKQLHAPSSSKQQFAQLCVSVLTRGATTGTVCSTLCASTVSEADVALTVTVSTILQCCNTNIQRDIAINFTIPLVLATHTHRWISLQHTS
jgi:Protein ENHANCED DISEASE RESISTANCE 2, C-terminal